MHISKFKCTLLPCLGNGSVFKQTERKERCYLTHTSIFPLLCIWHSYCWILWGIQNWGFGPCDFGHILILPALQFIHLNNGHNHIDYISGLLCVFLKITYKRGHYTLYTKGVSLIATGVVIIVTCCPPAVPFSSHEQAGTGNALTSE